MIKKIKSKIKNMNKQNKNESSKLKLNSDCMYIEKTIVKTV